MLRFVNAMGALPMQFDHHPGWGEPGRGRGGGKFLDSPRITQLSCVVAGRADEENAAVRRPGAKAGDKGVEAVNFVGETLRD